MKSKPKIAVIGLKGLPAFGGAATVGENIIEQLKGRYDFTVYSTSAYTNLKTGEYNGYKQIVFSQNKKSGLMTFFYYFKSVFHALFLENYNLIHLHHNAASFLIPFIRIRYKLILTTHGLFTEEKFHYLKYLYKIFDRLFLRYSSSITTVSKEDLRIVKNLGINKVKFIPNGINIIDRYYPTFENERDYLLFAAGRIHEGKGCHTFISALMAMEYTGRIIVAGDLDHSLKYKKRLLEMARTLKNVRFAGMIKDKNKLYSLIQNSKLFIYPSHAEAMSIMMLEVAALKTPMICCDCQVNRDLFSEDDVLFAEKGNVSDWKYKIEWALNNPNEMDKLAKHAYGKLLSQHSWDIISMQYEEIYKACIR